MPPTNPQRLVLPDVLSDRVGVFDVTKRKKLIRPVRWCRPFGRAETPRCAGCAGRSRKCDNAELVPVAARQSPEETRRWQQPGSPRFASTSGGLECRCGSRFGFDDSDLHGDAIAPWSEHVAAALIRELALDRTVRRVEKLEENTV